MNEKMSVLDSLFYFTTDGVSDSNFEILFTLTNCSIEKTIVHCDIFFSFVSFLIGILKYKNKLSTNN